MKAIFKKINFNIEDVMKEELPMMEYIYASKRQLKEDLSSLLYYPEKHQSNMPFYTLKEKSAENAAHTYNKLYIMLLAALDKLFKEDFNVIKKYFGTDFISQHPYFVDYARYTFKNKHPALYGRFDSAFDPETEKVKAVYEFNGDTPVMLFESVLLENRFIQEITGDSYAQFNDYFLDLQEFVKQMRVRDNFAVICDMNFVEDMATCETFAQIFNEKQFCIFDDIGKLDFDFHEKETSPFFVNDYPVSDIFILSPWEEMVEGRPDFFKKWQNWVDKVNFYEPAWRWFISNKGIWAYITNLFETDVDFKFEYCELPVLKTYLEPDKFIQQGKKYVAKPMMGRLSMNVRIMKGNETVEFESEGAYKEEPVVYQEYYEPHQVEGRNNFIACCWMSPQLSENGSTHSLFSNASTFCIREFDKPVLDIGNERFIPHIIIDNDCT